MLLGIIGISAVLILILIVVAFFAFVILLLAGFSYGFGGVPGAIMFVLFWVVFLFNAFVIRPHFGLNFAQFISWLDICICTGLFILAAINYFNEYRASQHDNDSNT